MQADKRLQASVSDELRLNRLLFENDADGFMFALADCISGRSWIVSDDALRRVIASVATVRAVSGKL